MKKIIFVTGLVLLVIVGVTLLLRPEGTKSTPTSEPISPLVEKEQPSSDPEAETAPSVEDIPDRKREADVSEVRPDSPAEVTKSEAKRDDSKRIPQKDSAVCKVHIDTSLWPAECKQIKHDLKDKDNSTRAEALLSYTRKKAGSGHRKMAAAAYAIFLNEYGVTKHPETERVSRSLGDYLAPIDTDSYSFNRSNKGLVFQTQWSRGTKPAELQLHQAIKSYELNASITTKSQNKGYALNRIAWLYRVIGDWEASTAAWDRCAREAPRTGVGQQALWHAAKNLTVTGKTAEAAKRYRIIASRTSELRRVKVALEYAEELEAKARRSTERWLKNPVASLKEEIEERSEKRSDYQVYNSVMKWLEDMGKREAMIEIARWARDNSDDWPTKNKISCRFKLAALQQESPEARDGELSEAAEALNEVLSIAKQPHTYVNAAVVAARLYSKLGQHEQARTILDGAEEFAKKASQTGHLVFIEKICVLYRQGDLDGAKAAYQAFSQSYPGYKVDKSLKKLIGVI
ncbi:MAG: tetratricopeptide repeat protein [Planctomycetota bacterium]|jgi:tetratricopeptide (TPR) repeat protein